MTLLDRTPPRPRSLIPNVWGWWWGRRVSRCEFPACGHVHTVAAAPRHLLTERCTGIVWWHGCLSWLAGHCTCPGCTPAQVPGPGDDARCSCPADTAPLV